MKSKKRASLEQYASRRFNLSGTSVVKDHFPYCRAVDEMGIRSRNDQPPTLASFAHYDYLNLGRDPRVLDAAKQAIDEIGVGAGASRLVGGELASHRLLESEISDFLDVESALCLVSGYGTNVTLISHLVTKDDLVIIDEAAHNSIMMGARMSRADTMTFDHNNLDHLDEILRQHRDRYARVLVAVEGLYSMDGDIPDLPRLVDQCRRHDAWLFVDEAHSIGVLGATGRGISEHFGMPASSIDLITGTMSKALVACGGFVGGKRSVIEWLRFTLPGFVYSVGIPPASVAATRQALAIIRDEPWRLRRLWDNSAHFLTEAKRYGLNVGNAAGIAVVPVLFSDPASAIKAAQTALSAGYYVPPIVQIAIPKDAPRLRFFVTAGHTKPQIDGVLEALAPIASIGEKAIATSTTIEVVDSVSQAT